MDNISNLFEHLKMIESWLRTKDSYLIKINFLRHAALRERHRILKQILRKQLKDFNRD